MNEGKIVLVTGATSGMGLATSIEMAKKGFEVVMVGRNEEKGSNALDYAKAESQSKRLSFMQCDLASIDSIRQFVSIVKKKYRKIDVLINNAGVLCIRRETTEDGFEMQMGVNHLGHFLLTNLLLELIVNAKEGRIVNVSSGGHKWGDFYKNDPHFISGYNLFKGYGQSKLANVLFTKELAKKLRNKNVTVNTLHPGAVATSLGVNRQTGFGKLIYKMLSPFFQTPLEGASTTIYLATSPEVKSISGEYFINKKIAKTSKKANDMDLAKHLWEWSSKEVSLDDDSYLSKQ
ncbi:SDR family oxidoreductase [Bacillus weihaiensis]|uniref:SDR family oxidoreductase n=1 Tax=Bacillus weihaiensis TaxID=1547283 RepID=UPI00235780C9|nr:SDR family oxidoreductase [Bacillus weihaiensis]